MHVPTSLLIALLGILNTPLSLAQIRHDPHYNYNGNPLLDNLIPRGGKAAEQEERIRGREPQEDPTTFITATTIITITTSPLTLTPTIIERNDPNACSSSYQSLLDTIPTPTGINGGASLLSALSPFLATADVADPTIYCAVVTALPDRQLRHDYRAWNDAMEHWCEDHGQALKSLAGVCVDGDGTGGGGGGMPSWATVDCGALERFVYRGCTGTAPVTVASDEGEGMSAWGARAAATTIA